MVSIVILRFSGQPGKWAEGELLATLVIRNKTGTEIRAATEYVQKIHGNVMKKILKIGLTHFVTKGVNMRKCIVILLCIFCSCSAKSDKTKFKSKLIGKTYSDARELGVTEGKTSELIPNSDYCVHWVTFDSTNVILLCKVDRSKNENNPVYIISDCLILPKMNDSLDFAIRGCKRNNNDDQYIIAILHHRDEFINKNIMKAWEANTTKGKIEEIAPEGFECENPNPNLD